jgi:hypothetical protein
MMSEGYIDALGNVVCPMHRYKYDVRNGRNTSGEGYYLTHWPVETREDGVYVGMETKGGLFGWFKKHVDPIPQLSPPPRRPRHRDPPAGGEAIYVNPLIAQSRRAVLVKISLQLLVW